MAERLADTSSDLAGEHPPPQWTLPEPTSGEEEKEEEKQILTPAGFAYAKFESGSPDSAAIP